VTALSTPEYDVVVVGAGPAGASAAAAVSKQGVNVLLIDSKSIPGTPVQCAEYVPRIVKQYVSLPPEAVVQKIDTLLTFINDELVSTLAGPGYILDRKIFDGSLVQDAIESGTEFWAGTKAISTTNEGIVVKQVGKENLEIKCKVIIGADGPRSIVGQWMNSENKKFMIGLQYRLPLCKYQASTDIYFKPEYEGGYAWVFPKGEYANIGVGVSTLYKNKLQLIIKEFINNLVVRGIVVDARPIEKTGGLIPVGGPLEVTQRENMLLTGDAAGHTHPVTGGGIMNAIVTGRMAGETAARAVINNDLTMLSQYPQTWQSFLGRYLNRATQQRNEMDHKWTYNTQQFKDLIRNNWFSFN
jgi:geranylgeranyl reductase family protein